MFGNNYPTPDGTAIRDYVHVVDLADAHIRALGHLRRGGASDFLNLGTGHGYSVMEVIEATRKVTGREIRARIEPPRAGDPPRLVADPTKSKSVSRLGPREIRSTHHHRIRLALAPAPPSRLRFVATAVGSF